MSCNPAEQFAENLRLRLPSVQHHTQLFNQSIQITDHKPQLLKLLASYNHCGGKKAGEQEAIEVCPTEVGEEQKNLNSEGANQQAKAGALRHPDLGEVLTELIYLIR